MAVACLMPFDNSSDRFRNTSNSFSLLHSMVKVQQATGPHFIIECKKEKELLVLRKRSLELSGRGQGADSCNHAAGGVWL